MSVGKVAHACRAACGPGEVSGLFVVRWELFKLLSERLRNGVAVLKQCCSVNTRIYPGLLWERDWDEPASTKDKCSRMLGEH